MEDIKKKIAEKVEANFIDIFNEYLESINNIEKLNYCHTHLNYDSKSKKFIFKAVLIFKLKTKEQDSQNGMFIREEKNDFTNEKKFYAVKINEKEETIFEAFLPFGKKKNIIDVTFKQDKNYYASIKEQNLLVRTKKNDLTQFLYKEYISFINNKENIEWINQYQVINYFITDDKKELILEVYLKQESLKEGVSWELTNEGTKRLIQVDGKTGIKTHLISYDIWHKEFLFIAKIEVNSKKAIILKTHKNIDSLKEEDYFN